MLEKPVVVVVAEALCHLIKLIYFITCTVPYTITVKIVQLECEVSYRLSGTQDL